MQIQINEETVEVPVEGLQSFGQLIQSIEQNSLEPTGRVITALYLNGRELDSQAESDHATFPLSRVESLKIRCSGKQDLALQALDDVTHILPELQSAIDECLLQFEDKSDNQGMQSFITVADGLSWLSTVAHGAETIFQETVQQHGLQNGDFMTACTRLQNLAKELLEAQQRSDFTTFRDILEYEVKPVLEDVQESTPGFRETLQKSSDL